MKDTNAYIKAGLCLKQVKHIFNSVTFQLILFLCCKKTGETSSDLLRTYFCPCSTWFSNTYPTQEKKKKQESVKEQDTTITPLLIIAGNFFYHT